MELDHSLSKGKDNSEGMVDAMLLKVWKKLLNDKQYLRDNPVGVN